MGGSGNILGFRVEDGERRRALHKRAAEIARRRGMMWGNRPSRSAVYREAVERGLELLEREGSDNDD